jgi:TonB family protein
MKNPWISGAALGLVLVAGVAAAADKTDGVVHPAWVNKPSEQDLMAVYPLKAHGAGRAVIQCEVSTEGVLRKCQVKSETPADQGFGVAALVLAPQFRFKPATRNGVPYAADVSIPISWPNRMPDSGQKLIPNPPWLAAPTRAEVRAVFPRGEKTAQTVLMVCSLKADGGLSNCETNGHDDFGFAARKLAPKFRADLTGVDLKTLYKIQVQMQVRLDPADNADTGGASLMKPNWATLPGAESFDALYPAAARAKGVGMGRSLIECTVGADGTLNACKTLSEDPAGLGFGEAALKISAAFKLNRWTDDGHAVDGALIRIPIKFVDPNAPEAAPAAK